MKKIIFIFLFIISFSMNSQTGIPIYSDYLTDNYYLIHPSTAGISNCTKLRITARNQWRNLDNAPNFQTLSIHSPLKNEKSGVGAILFNDKNGFHSTVGGYLTYAHHILLSRNDVDLEQLSFGLSAGVLQYKLDERSFLLPGDFDPLVSGVSRNTSNFNVDVGVTYQFLDFYIHATVKNLLNSKGLNYNQDGFSFSNLRNYLFSVAYVFQKFRGSWAFEPSILYQFKEAPQENVLDVNFKTYKELDFGKVWAGLSFRTSLNGAEFLNGDEISSTLSRYISPVAGISYKNFVFAYNYSYQLNDLTFNNGSFHQITIGFNFGYRDEKYEGLIFW